MGSAEWDHLNQISPFVHRELQEVDHGIPRTLHQDPAELDVRHSSISKQSGDRQRLIQCQSAVNGMLRISLQSG